MKALQVAVVVRFVVVVAEVVLYKIDKLQRIIAVIIIIAIAKQH